MGVDLFAQSASASANAFSDDILQSLEAGMNEHLAKPLDISLLTGVLRKYLGE